MTPTTYGKLVNGEIEYNSTPVVIEVVLDRVEGPIDECGKVIVNSLHAADMVIQDWAFGMDEDQGGYDKVDFKVSFSNGSQYAGRFDMKPSHRKTAEHLKDQMVGHIEWIADNAEFVGKEYATQAAGSLDFYRSL